MEILQTLITALTTPNEGLINLFSIPFSIIELTVTMLFFTYVLNIEASKKQKLTYIIFTSLSCILITNVLPESISPIVKILSYLMIMTFIFKISIFKSIIAEISILTIIMVFEPIIVKIFMCFTPENMDIAYIPIYRISIALILYSIFYITYRISKKFNINIKILDTMSKTNKIILSVNFAFGVVSVILQLFLFKYYNETIPTFLTIFGFLSLLVYFIISMYSLTRTTKLEITEQNLTQAQEYNNSLKVLYDHLRSFKHDFGNIMQAIGGYTSTNDMKGLQTYYTQLLGDCQTVNNLSALSPDVINNPAVYSILASKYLKGDELGIKINLDIFLDLNTLDTTIYQFTRILGILLDNAIEASIECNDKIINVEIRKDTKNNRQVLVIENTYANKDINIDEIFKKNYTSKENHSGIGLWEVNQILNKNTNLALYTTKNDVFFRQQFEIYEH